MTTAQQPSSADNFAVVTGSLGLSGTYWVDDEGAFAGNYVLGSTFPNYIGDRRTVEHLNLTVSENGKELRERFLPRGDAVVEILFRKVEEGDLERYQGEIVCPTV
jgi:hypothetical protein